MKNNIRIFCLFSICLGISACSNEYTHDNFKNFEELCEFSGGSYQKKFKQMILIMVFASAAMLSVLMVSFAPMVDVPMNVKISHLNVMEII